MSKRLLVFLLAASMTVLFAGVSASGDEHIPKHSHLLLINAELEFTPSGPSVTYDKCRDLANNRAVPLHAHHERLHVGTSGVSGVLFDGASGNLVVPAAGFPVPWGDCESFADIFTPND